MMSREEKLSWLANIDTIYKHFRSIPYFDESLRYEGEHVYHLVGEKSLQYDFECY